MSWRARTRKPGAKGVVLRIDAIDHAAEISNGIGWIPTGALVLEKAAVTKDKRSAELTALRNAAQMYEDAGSSEKAEKIKHRFQELQIEMSSEGRAPAVHSVAGEGEASEVPTELARADPEAQATWDADFEASVGHSGSASRGTVAAAGETGADARFEAAQGSTETETHELGSLL